MCFEVPMDIGRDVSGSPLQRWYETAGNPKWYKMKKQLP